MSWIGVVKLYKLRLLVLKDLELDLAQAVQHCIYNVFASDQSQFQPTDESWRDSVRENCHEPKSIVRNFFSVFEYLSYCGTILNKFNAQWNRSFSAQLHNKAFIRFF